MIDKSASFAMRVTILHLDLGIGGAEQLIVNIATVVKEQGHEVVLLTSHHDPQHCFEETKPNGYLGSSVKVHGDWLPRQLFGRFTAFFAILRMIYLALIAAIFHRASTDIVILDGVSAPIPILKLFGMKVLFYCHFPDLLLCYERSSILKKFYRYVLDGIEEWTTGCADQVLVNSEFTASIYMETFKQLARRSRPQVLYPVVKEVPTAELPTDPAARTPYCNGYETVFLSLNRYERKKNIALAISALQHFKTKSKGDSKSNASSRKVLLVIAGGYDLRVTENVEYLQELQRHCESCGLKSRFLAAAEECTTDLSKEGVEVVFRISIPSRERSALLLRSTGLLYTPDREHFGIVPIEAMYLQVPVIAVNSGGPTETVVNGVTGFLCNQNAEEFGDAMWKLMEEKTVKANSQGRSISAMGHAARQHVQNKFSFESMKAHLATILTSMHTSSTSSSTRQKQE